MTDFAVTRAFGGIKSDITLETFSTRTRAMTDTVKRADMDDDLVSRKAAIRAAVMSVPPDHAVSQKNIEDAIRNLPSATTATEVEKLRAALAPFAALELWTDTYPDGPLDPTNAKRRIRAEWIVAAREARALATLEKES